jgi:hypothetical protein
MSSSTTSPPPASFLDTVGARIVALAIFLVCAGALVWLNREAWLGLGPQMSAAEQALARCVAERTGDVDRMLEEGVIDEDQAELFRSRAEAMCVAMAGNGGTGPGQPPPQ